MGKPGDNRTVGKRLDIHCSHATHNEQNNSDIKCTTNSIEIVSNEQCYFLDPIRLKDIHHPSKVTEPQPNVGNRGITAQPSCAEKLDDPLEPSLSG